METLQQQVAMLSTKLDILSGQVADLSRQIAGVTPVARQPVPEVNPPERRLSAGYRAYLDPDQSELEDDADYAEYKDILLESDHSEVRTYQSIDHSMSPDVQIQRLTAQLTAAYNRIAALEEQLLSSKQQRTHFQ